MNWTGIRWKEFWTRVYSFFAHAYFNWTLLAAQIRSGTILSKAATRRNSIFPAEIILLSSRSFYPTVYYISEVDCLASIPNVTCPALDSVPFFPKLACLLDPLSKCHTPYQDTWSPNRGVLVKFFCSITSSPYSSTNKFQIFLNIYWVYIHFHCISLDDLIIYLNINDYLISVFLCICWTPWRKEPFLFCQL